MLELRLSRQLETVPLASALGAQLGKVSPSREIVRVLLCPKRPGALIIL
jgi:hypothetical protein